MMQLIMGLKEDEGLNRFKFAPIRVLAGPFIHIKKEMTIAAAPWPKLGGTMAVPVAK